MYGIYVTVGLAADCNVMSYIQSFTDIKFG